MVRSKNRTTEYKRILMRRALAILLCLTMVVGYVPLMGNYSYATETDPAVNGQDIISGQDLGDEETQTEEQQAENQEEQDLEQEEPIDDQDTTEEPVIEDDPIAEEDIIEEELQEEPVSTPVKTKIKSAQPNAVENEPEPAAEDTTMTDKQTADSVIAVGSGSSYVYFSDFEEGLEYAADQEKEVIAAVLSGKTVKLTGEAGAESIVVGEKVTLVISNGAKLLIPFKDENGNDSDKSSSDGADQQRVAWAAENNGKYLNQTLEVEAGGEIKVEDGGILTVAGVTGTTSDYAPQGQTTGSYSQIINNGKITVDGTMEVFGLVDGSGAMVISSKGTLTEPFYIADFPGGTNMLGAIDEMFPCNEYGMNNIHVPITLYAGGRIVGEAKIYVFVEQLGVEMFAIANMTVVGMQEGIIKLSSGTAHLQFNDDNPFDPDLGTLDLSVRGSGSIGLIESTIAGISVSSKNKFISIPYNFNLILEQGDYLVNSGVYTKLMPGSKFTIKDGATVTVKSGARLAAYNGLQMAKFGNHRYPTADELQSAGYSAAGQLIIDGGTLTVENGGTFAGIVQNTGSGKVVTQKGAILNLGADGTFYDGAETSTQNIRTYMDIDAKYWNGVELVSMTSPAAETKTYTAYSGDKALKNFTIDRFECTKWHENATVHNVEGGIIKYKDTESRSGAWDIYDVDLTDFDGTGYKVTFTGDNQALLDKGAIQPGQTVTVTISVDKGYTIDDAAASETNAPKISVTNAELGDASYKAEGGKHIYTYTVSDVDGTLTIDLDSVIADTGLPTGEVIILNKVGEEVKSWVGKLFEEILERLHLRSVMDVKITANDDASGIKEVSYLTSTRAVSKDTLVKSTAWKPLTSDNWAENGAGFTFEEAGITGQTDGSDLIVYVKIVDNADNTSYISTDGMRVDNTAPVVKSGSNVIDNGAYFYQKYATAAMTVTVTDKNLKTIKMIDESTGEEVIADGNTFTVYPKASRTAYTVYAADEAGNALKGDGINEGLSFYYVQPLTVTFTSEYAADQKVSYEYDEEIAVPEDPKPDSVNAAFLGWFDKNGNKLETGTKAAANITYTAKYDMTYDVQLPAENNEYKLEADLSGDSFPAGTKYTFKLANKNSDKYCSFVVKANGEAVEDANGVYTVEIVDKAVKITVEPVEHDIYAAERVESTCETKGYEINKCHNCTSYNKDNEKIELEIAPHTYKGDTVRVEPTCEQMGTITGVCSVCGDASGVTYIPALGHNYTTDVDSDKNREATCYQTGIQVKKCSNDNCDASEGSETKVVYTAKLAHTPETDAGKPATCDEPGLTEGSHCAVEACGKVLVSQEVIPALGHKWEVISEKAATCTEAGLKIEKCKTCQDVKETVLNPSGHEWYVAEDKAATCTAEGKTIQKCALCEEELVEVKEKLKHDYKLDKTISKTANCTEDGYDVYVCADCGKEEIRNYVYALGHKTETIEGTEATCISTGLSAGSKCSVCNEIIDKQIVIPKTDHVWESEPKLVSEPTCDVDGFEQYECSQEGCPEKKMVILEAKGHDWSNYTVVQEPSCTTVGIEYAVCQNEGCRQFKNNITDALGHVSVDVEAKSPTCTEDGHNAYKYCTRCESVLGAPMKVLPATGHTEVTVPGVEPGCETDGKTESKYCSECSAVLVEEEVIPATGHTYSSDVTKATCTEGGYTTYTCECGDSYVADRTEPLKHKYSSITTFPTCTEDGFTVHTCHVCDYTYTDNVKPATGHTMDEEWQIKEEPTCTEDGVRIKSCADCDYVVTDIESEEIKATGHDYVPVVTAPTCTEDGFTTYTCADCGDSYVDEESIVSETGHKPTAIEKKDADCDTDGLISGTYCSVCEEVLSAEEVLPALGHEWKTVSETEANCTEAGLKVEKCSVCDKIQETVTDALGHKLVDYDGKAATCTEDGYEAYEECTVCEYTTYKDIKSEGHKYIEEVIDPTCDEAGKIIKTCKCGHTETAEGEPAKDHTEKVLPAVPATETSTGLTEGKYCSGCGEILVGQELVDALKHVHKETVVEGREATCTVSGLTDGVVCELCGETLVKQEVINVLPHEYGEWTETKVATCTEPGKEERTCECGAVQKRYTDTSKHVLGEEYYLRPTKETTGGTYAECSNCDHTEWIEVQTWEEYVKKGVETTTISVTATAKLKTERIYLDWSKSDGYSINYYKVYRSTSGKTGTFNFVAKTTGMSYIDKAAKPGTTYYYKVIGYRNFDNKVFNTKHSNAASAKIKKVTAAYVKDTSISISTTYASKGVKVSWKDPRVKVDGFKIYRATSLNGTYKLVKTVNSGVRIWSNTGLKVGKKYYYKVRGFKTVNGKLVYTKYSLRSGKYALKTSQANIAADIQGSSAVTATKAVKINGGIKVTWTKKAAIKCTNYKVYRATSKNGTYKLIAKTSNKYYNDKSKSLKKGKRYYYKIAGYRIYGKAVPQTDKSDAVSAVR